jgi:hypothetical protein
MRHASTRTVRFRQTVDEFATTVGEQHPPVVSVVLAFEIQHLEHPLRGIALLCQEIYKHVA